MAWWKREGRGRRALHPQLDNDPRFRCCGCCHVQTGTICLGVYNLILQLVCMTVLVFAILHPDMLLDRERLPIDHEVRPELAEAFPDKTAKNDGKQDVLPRHPDAPQEGIQELPTPVAQRREGGESGGDGVFYMRRDMLLFTRKRVESGDAHLALALVFGLVIITSLMIYGAVKSRPVYLLPFFCFQVFDFILACLTAVSHYTWLPSIHHEMMKDPDMPFRHHLSQMNGQWVALTVLLLYILALVLKAYFIGVVWAAYQYLQIRNAGVVRYTATETDGLLLPDQEPELLLPPDYETASKMPPPYQPGPPPGYSSA